VGYTHPLDTMGLIMCQRSGHMGLKPHYNAKQLSWSSYGYLRELSHPYHYIKAPKYCHSFFKALWRHEKIVVWKLEKQTWLRIYSYVLCHGAWIVHM